jgi:predicted esterase
MITEHHITVSRTARYSVIGQPGAAVNDLWVVCHGYAQLSAKFIRRFRPLAAAHRLVVAPEALSRFYVGDHTRPAGPDSVIGASWMTREERDSEIADYVTYLDTLLEHVVRGISANHRISLLGFSQGSATVSRWVLRGAVAPARVILWGAPAAADADLSAAARKSPGMEWILVSGDTDPYVTSKVRDREQARMRSAGLRVRMMDYQGGHEIHEPTLLALASE